MVTTRQPGPTTPSPVRHLCGLPLPRSHRGVSALSLPFLPSFDYQLSAHNSLPLSPFPATLTRYSHIIENTATLSPAFATLTGRVKHKFFVCHSYKKHPGWGYRLASSPLRHTGGTGGAVPSTPGRGALLYASTCGKNRGAFRNFVACSKPYASLIKTGSLQARPKNEIPTGKPNTNPAVTFTFGYPAAAANFELPPPNESPFTMSVNHAGPPVGATMASSLFLSIVTSIPSLPASSWFFLIASTYSCVVSGPFSSAFRKFSCPKNGISFAAFFSLNSMMSFSVFTGAFGPSHRRYAFKSAFSSYMNPRNSVSPNLPDVSISTGSTSVAPCFFITWRAASINLSTAGLKPNAFRKTPMRAPFNPSASRNLV